jgi:hypothetical protein
MNRIEEAKWMASIWKLNHERNKHIDSKEKQVTEIRDPLHKLVDKGSESV